MAGGNLAAGIGLISLVAVCLFLVEFIESDHETGTPTTGSAPGSGFDCDTGVTFDIECDSDFSDGLDIGQIDGAPAWVNGIVGFALGIALAAGLILLIAGIIGTPLGGG